MEGHTGSNEVNEAKVIKTNKSSLNLFQDP